MSDDETLARLLQEEFDAELLASTKINDEVADFLPSSSQFSKAEEKLSGIIDPNLDLIDPNPDLHALFSQFNQEFFWGKLNGCEVKWSPRMTLCAGVCSYQYRSGFCSIRLSCPLLKLRPRKDFVETLLHEMIHAYLFVTDGNDDHDGHGPAFHEHMYRINKKTGTNISVYHNFHDEVDSFRTHWWQCDGPCRSRKPFYGLVKRAMNRVPGPNDNWWSRHQSTCGGTYTKIKEPENYGKKKTVDKRKKTEIPKAKGQPDIRSAFPTKVPKNEMPGTSTSAGGSSMASHNPGAGPKGNIFGFSGQNQENIPKNKASGSKNSGNSSGGGPKGNIFGFGGLSFTPPTGDFGGLQTKGKSGAFVKNPGWKTRDNSSSGHVINQSNTIGNGEPPGSSNSQTGDVKDQLRKVWASKFGQENSDQKNESHTSKNPKSLKSITSKSQNPKPLVKCPVCSSSMSASLINDHLDNECLQDDTGLEAGSIENEHVQTCPICQKAVHKDLMNTHLDNECLQDDTGLENGGVACSNKNEHVQICQICQKAVHKDLMNTHLDFCEAPEAVAT